MARRGFDSRRDQAVADDAIRQEREPAALRCMADNCPGRWSVEIGSSRLCSAHAFVRDPAQWPAISDRLRAQAFNRAPSPPARHGARVSIADRRAIMARIAGMSRSMAARDGLQWARDLEAADLAGEKLTLAQRDMYRSALGIGRHQPMSAPGRARVSPPLVEHIESDQEVSPW